MGSWKLVWVRDTVLGREHGHTCVQRLEWLRMEELAALRLILPPLSQHGPRHPHRATAGSPAAGDLEGSSALVSGGQSASLPHLRWWGDCGGRREAGSRIQCSPRPWGCSARKVI